MDLLAFLEGMNGVRWIVIGLVLLVLELLTGTLYILWVAVAAILVGIVTFLLPGNAWQAQMVLFAVLSIISLVVGDRYLRPKIHNDAAADLNTPGNAMVGKRVRAVIDFDAGIGRVRVGDTEWRAKLAQPMDGDALPDPKAGDEVWVTSVAGATLQVRPRGLPDG